MPPAGWSRFGHGISLGLPHLADAWRFSSDVAEVGVGQLASTKLHLHRGVAGLTYRLPPVFGEVASESSVP